MSAKTYPLFSPTNRCGIFHYVVRGDTLFEIIEATWQVCVDDPHEVIGIVHADNPHIKNPDLIYPGDLIFIRNANYFGPLGPGVCQDIKSTNQCFGRGSSTGKQIPTSLGHPIDWGSLSRTVVLGTAEDTVAMLQSRAGAAATSISRVRNAYLQRKAGEISAKAYTAIRKTELPSITSKLGPLEAKFLGGNAQGSVRAIADRGLSVGPLEAKFLGGNAQGSVRAIADRGLSVTQRAEPMLKQASRLKTVGGHLARAGVVLKAAPAVIDVGFTHHAVCTASTSKEKDRALLAGVGSIVAGGIVTVVLISNPVGWVAGIAIGVAAGAAGTLAGQLAHDQIGDQVEIVESIPISGGCSIYQ